MEARSSLLFLTVGGAEAKDGDWSPSLESTGLPDMLAVRDSVSSDID